VLRIVLPVFVAFKPPTSEIVEAVMEAVMVEEEAIYEEPATKPIAPPTPTAPSQAAEESTNVDARPESESKTYGIVKRRVITIHRWSPDVFRIVSRNINYLRIGRLDINSRLAPFFLFRNRLLSVRI
jgi:hypothetical protein